MIGESRRESAFFIPNNLSFQCILFIFEKIKKINICCLIARCLFLIFSSVFMSFINAQVLFSENFEGVISNTTKLPLNWQETGSSLDGIYTVGDSSLANYLLNQTSLWKVPNHTKFVMTNDVRCSYEKGIGYCNKSKDRLILPVLNIPNYSGSLILNFDHFFTGKLGSQAAIEVSINGGSTWIKEFDLIADESKWRSNSVNLSKYIGVANVLISFLYNDNDLVRDGLAIDNVELKKQVPWKDVSLDYVDAAKYSIIPIAQVDSIPLRFIFHNEGTLVLDTVQLNVQIIEQGFPKKILFNATEIYQNLKLKDTVSFLLGKFLPTKKNTTYIIKHWVKTSKDTVIRNDSLNIPIYISQGCYARDNASVNSTFDLSSANTITIGNLFSFNKKSFIDSIYFESGSATNGTSVQAFIFPVIDGKVSLVEIGKSDVFTLSNGVNTKFLKVKSNLSDKVLIDTGEYLVAIQKTNGGGSMGIKLCDNFYQKNTVFMRIGQVSFQTLDSYFSGTKKSVPIIQAFTSPFCNLSTKIDKINTKCQFATGELKVTPVQATFPVTYLWNTGETDSVISKLPVGLYSVKVTDYHNCVFDSINISLNPFSKPIIEIDSLRNPLCYNQSSGYISITTDNPGIITKVKWNGVTSNQVFIDNAKSGLYTVKVVDGNNCEDSLKVTLSNPDSLTIDYLVKDESVKAKGIISLFVSGGNSPYSYYWGDTIYTKNRTELIGDSSYVVVVSDTNGCKKSTQIYVGSTLAIEEEELEFITFYPNPVEDILNIETLVDINKIAVVDLSGKICKQVDFIRNLNTIFSIDLHQLEKGVYYLYVQRNGLNNQYKFLKN